MDDDDYCAEYNCPDEEELSYDIDDLCPDTAASFNRLKSQSSMIFFRSDDIKKILDKKIEELQELLETTYDETLILYHYFKWNRDKLENSEWFCNQESLSKKAGLMPKDERTTQVQSTECPICMGEYSLKDLDGLNCKHMICKHCWDCFINEQVNLNQDNFFWKCPGQNEGTNCNIIVPDSFNRKYLRKENETKYIRQLCMSYAEENKAVRWCPAPNCIYCVENPSLTMRTIRCKCSTMFCFKCGLEDHMPCSCELALSWQNKNVQESENTKWIAVYTKMCPKCNRPIEKNQGCNHMTCKHKGCGHEFCWLCLNDWKTHQGSHYKCNKYEALNEEEKSQLNQDHPKEKADLEKYVFYFERFSNNERAYQIARNIHQKMEQNVVELHTKLNLPYGEINFLTDATEELQRARKLLKWTYAYAYYIEDKSEKNLFEFHQKDLEKYCEDLNEALEMNYAKSITNPEGVLDLKSFLGYKDKVTTSCFKCQKFSDELGKVIAEGLEKKH